MKKATLFAVLSAVVPVYGDVQIPEGFEIVQISDDPY